VFAVKMLLPLALLAFATVAADKPAPKRPDKDRIQGTWALVAWEEDGKKESREEFEARAGFRNVKITFKGDSCPCTYSQGAGEVVLEMTFKLDPDKKPAALDLEVNLGLGPPSHNEFVYEFVDDDTLRICRGKKQEVRPKELTSKGGQFVATLKRERKRPEK
jgi:uncharacterized protein (TIGR03067 family)